MKQNINDEDGEKVEENRIQQLKKTELVTK